MKKHFLLGILVSITFSLSSQTVRKLFDATIIRDMEGRKILEKEVMNEENLSIPVASLRPGLYFFQILGGGRIINYGKFIKL